MSRDRITPSREPTSPSAPSLEPQSHPPAPDVAGERSRPSGPGRVRSLLPGASPRIARLARLLSLLLVGFADDAAATQAPGGGAVDASVAYTGEIAANVRGGIRRGVVGLGKLDATLRVDGGALLGWKGTSTFLHALATHGAEPSELTGDAQVASNIQAPDGVRLYETWIQTNLPDADLSLLVGLYDVNSEFDVAQEARLFLNSSFGIGAELGTSGVNGPSTFPATSLGARLRWHPTRRWYLQGAVLDGIPGDPSNPGATSVQLSSRDGALWVAEAGFAGSPGTDPGAPPPRLGRGHAHAGGSWRVAVGLWQYTRRAEQIGGGKRVRARPGGYLLAEGRPYRETDPEQGLGLFVRLGVADGRTNRFGAYAGGGLTYAGPVPGRDRDVIGVGVASARNGDAYASRRRNRGGRSASGAETAVELSYRARLVPWISVQPDLQLVLDPDTDPSLGSALLLTLRVAVEP